MFEMSAGGGGAVVRREARETVQRGHKGFLVGVALFAILAMECGCAHDNSDRPVAASGQESEEESAGGALFQPPPREVLARQLAMALLPRGVRMTSEGRLFSTRDGAELVLVQAGAYAMGDDNGSDDARPQHEVFVSSILVDRHEVTNRQFGEFVASSGYVTEAETENSGYTIVGQGWSSVRGVSWRQPWQEDSQRTEDGGMPVVMVTWNDAVAFCDWAGRRLLTEAEFEKCMRAGAHGMQFPWGNDERPVGVPGNFADESARRRYPSWRVLQGFEDGCVGPARVGAFGQNALGICDAAGNVWEWCRDWYGGSYYSQSPVLDPQGPLNGESRVIRGGGWIGDPAMLRCASRYENEPRYRSASVGFRCAINVPEVESDGRAKPGEIRK